MADTTPDPATTLPDPKVLDLFLMAYMVLAYWEEAQKTPDTQDFFMGYDRGAGRSALRLWMALTGYQVEAQALDYARQVTASSAHIHAAVAPF